jgi:hypothetical protein
VHGDSTRSEPDPLPSLVCAHNLCRAGLTVRVLHAAGDQAKPGTIVVCRDSRLTRSERTGAVDYGAESTIESSSCWKSTSRRTSPETPSEVRGIRPGSRHTAAQGLRCLRLSAAAVGAACARLPARHLESSTRARGRYSHQTSSRPAVTLSPHLVRGRARRHFSVLFQKKKERRLSSPDGPYIFAM